MKIIPVILAMSVLMAPPAIAATDSSPGRTDPRIKTYLYQEDEVYRLDVHLFHITTVSLNPKEQIESVLIGDSASWQVIRLNRGDTVAVKPLIDNAATNLTIVTDKRTYAFDLRTVGETEPGDDAIAYRVKFAFPSEAVQQYRINQLQRTPDDDAPLNRDYYAASNKRRPFAPFEVFDDGRMTTFTFRPGAPRPAIFRVDETGAESIVNVTHVDNRAVVHSVSDRWTVRIGDHEICVASGAVLQTLPDTSQPRRPDGNPGNV